MAKIRIQFTLFSAFYSPLISAMSAPLLARERAFGAITFVSTTRDQLSLFLSARRLSSMMPAPCTTPSMALKAP